MKLIALTLLVALTLTGCVTPVDWNARIGVYTYDQAVTDYGRPMSLTTVNGGSTVAEWMTRRSQVVASPGPVIYSPGSYAPRGIGYDGPGAGLSGYSTTYFPAEFLRLEFGSNGRLTAWKEFAK